MSDFYTWLIGGLVVIGSIIFAWVNGRSKGKAVAEQKAREQKTREQIASAERQVTTVKEASHVDQKVNNSTDADVDKQLLDKWTRPGSR